MSNSNSDQSSVEHAKAEQEKWKTIQKSIPLTEQAGHFIAKIVGPSAIALGGLLGDQLKAWRAQNLDRISQKWERIRNEREVRPEVIQNLPFGDAYRAIEAASMEEDPDVQELWARLLFNASNSDHKAEMKKMYIDLLGRINGLEARILSVHFHYAHIMFEIRSDKMPLEHLEKILGKTDSEEVRIALLNLQHLGILTPSISEHEIFETTTHESWINSINESNFIDKFALAISNIVGELTYFSGSPMNNTTVPRERLVGLVLAHELTAIGLDLYESCS